MRKHPHFVIRTIRKDGTIKWNHRIWAPRNLWGMEQLIGKRLVFGTYAPDYTILCLWGTPQEHQANSEAELDAAAAEATCLYKENKLKAKLLVCLWWEAL